MSEFIQYPKPSGASYVIPDVGDNNWGQNVTDFLVAIPNGTVPTAGTFTLTGDLSWGTSFGLLSKYFTSLTANPASAGVLRLAKTDAVEWRNNANSANLALAINGSDQLTFNGTAVQPILAIGNLTDVGTDGIVVTGGTGAVIGAGTSLAQHVADTTHSGYLSSTDWNTFNGKQPGGTYVTSVTGTANEIIVGGTSTVPVLSTPQAIGTGSSPTFAGMQINCVGGGVTLGDGSTHAGGLTIASIASLAGSIAFQSKDQTALVNINAPATGSTYQMILPGTQGTVGQKLTIASVIGGVITLAWS